MKHPLKVCNHPSPSASNMSNTHPSISVSGNTEIFHETHHLIIILLQYIKFRSSEIQKTILMKYQLY